MLGLLHPGAMGAVVAKTLCNSGHAVAWVAEGRSAASRARAEDVGLRDAGTLGQFCRNVEVIFSVCPPEFAEDVADQVLACGYRGSFVDANAISPERVLRMAERMQNAGVTFIDGGITGPSYGANYMCLAGPGADRIGALFTAGPMQPDVLGTEIGRASALKVCYAAYMKGTRALELAVLAVAQRQGVWPDLERHWALNGSLAKVKASALVAGPKAWRFAGEMREIAETFAHSDVPDGFHLAAAEMFERLAEFKDRKDLTLEEILERLRAR